MLNTGPTSFRFTDVDKSALRELAERLRMGKTALIRALIHETLAILQERDAQSEAEKRSGRAGWKKNVKPL